jgi:hypothetical protein
VKPDSFAAVMATGIVSIAAVDHGYRAISDVLIVLATVALPVLIVAAATAWRRESWNLANIDVSLGLCTYIAACAVVGARLAEHRVVLWVLAGMALQGWLSLAPMVTRRMWRDRGAALRDRAHSGWELASVATSGLAIVMGDLKIVFLAMLFWAIAIGVYLLMTGLIVWRSHPQGRVGERLAGDGRDVVCRDGVDPAADLRHPATVSEAKRTSARVVVGGGVPTRDVLVGDVCHGCGNRLALADDGVAGVLLDRIRRVDTHCTPRAIANRISASTRCGYSVRSSQVNRNTFHPSSEM